MSILISMGHGFNSYFDITSGFHPLCPTAGLDGSDQLIGATWDHQVDILVLARRPAATTGRGDRFWKTWKTIMGFPIKSSIDDIYTILTLTVCHGKEYHHAIKNGKPR